MDNYRKMLDQQINIKNQFKMYGNMTSVEKALNRPELEAFKNYDNNQYCLIPGLNSQKAMNGNGTFDASRPGGSPGSSKAMSPGMKSKSIDFEQKYWKKQNELQKLGYNETGERRSNLNDYGGRNFLGHKQHQPILGEFNQIHQEPMMSQNNMKSGPASLNIGERQRQLIRNTDIEQSMPPKDPDMKRDMIQGNTQMHNTLQNNGSGAPPIRINRVESPGTAGNPMESPKMQMYPSGQQIMKPLQQNAYRSINNSPNASPIGNARGNILQSFGPRSPDGGRNHHNLAGPIDLRKPQF